MVNFSCFFEDWTNINAYFVSSDLSLRGVVQSKCWMISSLANLTKFDQISKCFEKIFDPISYTDLFEIMPLVVIVSAVVPSSLLQVFVGVGNFREFQTEFFIQYMGVACFYSSYILDDLSKSIYPNKLLFHYFICLYSPFGILLCSSVFQTVKHC